MNHSKINGGEGTGNSGHNDHINAEALKTAEEERINRMNGVVCWFYVYNNTQGNTPSICGIVIIKRIIPDPDPASAPAPAPDTATEDKIFFYTPTKLTNSTFENDELIQSFISTAPTGKAIKAFIDNNNNTKKIVTNYSVLPTFLDDLKNNNFVYTFDG